MQQEITGDVDRWTEFPRCHVAGCFARRWNIHGGSDLFKNSSLRLEATPANFAPRAPRFIEESVAPFPRLFPWIFVLLSASFQFPPVSSYGTPAFTAELRNNDLLVRNSKLFQVHSFHAEASNLQFISVRADLEPVSVSEFFKTSW